MFDAEHLLGGLLTGALRGRVPSKTGLVLGMGAIGVAIAAWEHYQQQQDRQDGASQGVVPPPLPVSPTIPPPLPNTWNAPGSDALSPSLTGPGSSHPGQGEALHLVHAMAIAAWADGVVDDDERERILARLESSGVDENARTYFAELLNAPKPLEPLLAQVASPYQAEQFYLVSLLAINADTEAEKQYLQGLAKKLALDDATIHRLHDTVSRPVSW